MLLFNLQLDSNNVIVFLSYFYIVALEIQIRLLFYIGAHFLKLDDIIDQHNCV